MANWAKARKNSVEVFGERLALLLGGHSSPRTDRRHLHMYNSEPLGVERTSMLATPRILISMLATARVLCSLKLAFFCLPSPQAVHLSSLAFVSLALEPCPLSQSPLLFLLQLRYSGVFYPTPLTLQLPI